MPPRYRNAATQFVALNGGRVAAAYPVRATYSIVGRFRCPAMFVAPALFLAGCTTVGPDYKAPTAHLAAFHSQQAMLIRNEKLPTADMETWWTSFKDPELTHLILQAQLQNMDIAQAMARLQQSRAGVKAATARLMPSGTLQLQTDAMHQSLLSPIGELASPYPGYARNEALFDENVGVSWEPDLFGGLHRARESAIDRALSDEADSDGIRIEVQAEVADVYFRIRNDQYRVVLTHDQIVLDTKLLELVAHRYKEGASSERELYQAKALVEQAQSRLPGLAVDIEKQSDRLDVLLGNQPGQSTKDLAKFSGMLPTVPAIRADLTPSDLLRHRPDIISAERRLAASNADIGVAIAEYYPQVSLGGLLGAENLSNHPILSAASFQPALIAGFRWRLFDFGAVDADVQRAKGANAEALARYKETVLSAIEDVEVGFTSVVQYEIENKEIEGEVASLEHANRNTNEAYEAGAVSLTDVLDTERQLLLAKDDEARSSLNELLSAVYTYRAMGAGWQ